MNALLLLKVLIACSGEEGDPLVPLPPEDTARTVDSSSGFPLDSLSDSGQDQTPVHTLTLEQWGQWKLSPFGGPYTGLVGDLNVLEYLDGQRPDLDDTGLDSGGDTGMPDPDALQCQASFSLIGEALPEGCASCDFVFKVQIFLVEGDPSTCRDPDLPQDGEERVWGYSDDEGLIYYDYGSSGLWLPWWQAIRAGDSIEFEWIATMGIAVEEEEEE